MFDGRIIFPVCLRKLLLLLNSIYSKSKIIYVNFIENTRQSVGSFFLKRDLAKVVRSKQIVNMKDIRTIGIVYDASEEETYAIVSNFVRRFQEDQKIVRTLGFVNFRRLPHYCFPKLSYDYFTRRDLNLYFKPVNIKANEFVNEEFDVVIDLCMNDCFPIRYVTGLSKAKLKVGRFGDKYSGIYDFMLNVDNTISLGDFINEITHYLTIINKE